DMLAALVVERVCQSVRPDRGRAVLEEQGETGRVGRFRRVVERLAVVGVCPRLLEHAGQLGVVRDPGCAVERGYVAVLVLEGRVWVGAPDEELLRERRGRKARVADVEERSPAAWPTGRVRVALPGATERERCPGVVDELRPGREQCLRAGALPIGGGEDEFLRGGIHLRDGRGGPLDERLERATLPAGLRIAGEARERIGRVELAWDVGHTGRDEPRLCPAPHGGDRDERERECRALAQPLVRGRVRRGGKGDADDQLSRLEGEERAVVPGGETVE